MVSLFQIIWLCLSRPSLLSLVHIIYYWFLFLRLFVDLMCRDEEERGTNNKMNQRPREQRIWNHYFYYPLLFDWLSYRLSCSFPSYHYIKARKNNRMGIRQAVVKDFVILSLPSLMPLPYLLDNRFVIQTMSLKGYYPWSEIRSRIDKR